MPQQTPPFDDKCMSESATWHICLIVTRVPEAKLGLIFIRIFGYSSGFDKKWYSSKIYATDKLIHRIILLN